MIHYGKIFISSGFVVCCVLFYFACSSSIPNMTLKKDYDFQNKKSVLVYVGPADKQVLNETYGRVLYLDLLARGYNVTNANILLKENSDKVTGKSHREIADSLLVRQYLPKSDVIAVAKTNWDSTLELTYYAESRTVRGKYFWFSGKFAKKLTSQVAFYDRLAREPILSFAAADTAYLYAGYSGWGF